MALQNPEQRGANLTVPGEPMRALAVFPAHIASGDLTHLHPMGMRRGPDPEGDLQRLGATRSFEARIVECLGASDSAALKGLLRKLLALAHESASGAAAAIGT